MQTRALNGLAHNKKYQLFMRELFTQEKNSLLKIFSLRLNNTLKALWLKYMGKYERFRETMREIKIKVFYIFWI